MYKACLIIGLPCSGKRWLANQLVNFTDEIVHNEPIKAIEHILSIGKDIIITSDVCCDKQRRRSFVKELKKFNYDVFEVYFAKNPDVCKKNAAFLGEEIDFSQIEYNLPYGQKTIPIHDFTTNQAS